MFKKLIKLLLRRSAFKGQDRLFYYFFKNGWLDQGKVLTKPTRGNFKISGDTGTWIGAKIVYVGDYEPELKKVFCKHIKKGFRVLDVGANVGFHTLFFAELVGETGKVIAFEPIQINFEALIANIELNTFTNIEVKNFALSNKTEELLIDIDEDSKNPGAFNLFAPDGKTIIKTFRGDEIIKEAKIDFIKIDVEGYESFVLLGLMESIKKSRPIIVFEFDANYHKKTGLKDDFIFKELSTLNYKFFLVQKAGLKLITDFDKLISGNILSLPNE